MKLKKWSFRSIPLPKAKHILYILAGVFPLLILLFANVNKTQAVAGLDVRIIAAPNRRFKRPFTLNVPTHRRHSHWRILQQQRRRH